MAVSIESINIHSGCVESFTKGGNISLAEQVAMGGCGKGHVMQAGQSEGSIRLLARLGSCRLSHRH